MLFSQEHFRRTVDGCVHAMMFLLAFATCVRAEESVRDWRAVSAKPYGLPGAERRMLDGAVRFIAREQWDDAIDAITQLLQSEAFGVIEVDDDRFISLREQCHALLRELPSEALAKYRVLVDSAAESWYRQGIADRDAVLLQRVVDHYFCSSWGDDAAFALGELALRRGAYQQARNAWERLDGSDGSMRYPGSDIPAAAVHACLVLLSIREGDWQSAEQGVEQLAAEFSQAKGRLGGREVVYASHLRQLVEEAKRWPTLSNSAEWPTFAANLQRTNSTQSQREVGSWELVWSQPFANEQLAVFPVVVNDLVIYQDDSKVLARRLSDGQEVFRAEGEDFRSPELTAGWLGASHHTLTADGNYVFGVTRSALGSSQRASSFRQRSRMWGLDLQRGGSLVMSQPIESADVSFAGAPVHCENNLYVPICSNDQTARMGIACFDLEVNQWRWRRWLCQANTPATGWAQEIACNLLTYNAGVVYANTNLGAVAAVRADDGQVLWLRTYERQSCEVRSNGRSDYYRAAAPCMFHQGKVYVLPIDGRSLLALDARTGQQLWHYPIDDPAAQLVGVTDTRVVVLDDELQVLDRETGALAGESEFGRFEGWPAVRTWDTHAAMYIPSANSAELFFSSFDLKSLELHFDGMNLADTSGANMLLVGESLIVAGRTTLSVLRNQVSRTEDQADLPSLSKE